jgi:ATP synthase protein I
MVQQRKSGPGTAAEASRYLGVGLTWALSTALFLYLGSVTDRWLGTAPWLTLIGAFVGAAAGFWYMYRQLVIDPERKRAAERRSTKDAAAGEEGDQ